jgi:hypothetical protein
VIAGDEIDEEWTTVPEITCSVMFRACGISESASELWRFFVKLHSHHDHDSSVVGVPQLLIAYCETSDTVSIALSVER